jgi:hypothetical protein
MRKALLVSVPVVFILALVLAGAAGATHAVIHPANIHLCVIWVRFWELFLTTCNFPV